MDISNITGNLSDARFVPSSGVALPVALTEEHTVYNYPQHGDRVGFYLKELPYTILKVERDDGVVYKEMEVDAVLGDLNFAVRKERHNLGFLWFGDASLEGRRFTVSYQGLGMINHIENMLFRVKPAMAALVESPINPPETWKAEIHVNHPDGVDIWITGQGGKGENGKNGGSVSGYGSGGSGGTGAYGMKLDKCKIQLTNGTYIIKSQLINTQKGNNGSAGTSSKYDNGTVHRAGGAGGAGGTGGRSIGIQRTTINSNSNVDALQYILLIYGGSGGGGGGGGGALNTATGGKGGSSTEITAFNSYFLALGGGILGYSAPTTPSGMNGTAGQRAPVFGSSATTSDYWIKIEARAIDIVKNNITLI